MALVTFGLNAFNQTQENEERRRVMRMRRVLAVVTGKSVATHQTRERNPGRSDTVVGHTSYMIEFECQVGGAVVKGNRLSLFRIDERALWRRFEEGKQYEAHFDPELNDCILVVDEPPGGQSRQNRGVLYATGLTAVLALAVFLATRRWSDDAGSPAVPGSSPGA